ncbi:MarR family winged helix-turn-helix transcriptional regulator [Actinoplanes sp. NPDC049599]|uniref:MarR family winged helix-turn-helix transcriptional regulator n=1 Tax=Actinoplanes sp. NPDC049599 TaxID=3363903 RepID=UPI00378D2356
MTQPELVGPVENAVGYVLKEAAVALRAALDAVLRPLDLTVSQYACLELLGQRPGLSNADLARGTFVTRQSMNVVLQGLQARGLVTRPATAARGRELPAVLTEEGRRQLLATSAAVRSVEKRMCAGLSADQQQVLLETLAACVRNLTAGVQPSSDGTAEANALPGS